MTGADDTATRPTTAAAGPARAGAEPDVLTIDEAATWLRVDRKTLYDAANRRAIPCARLGRRILLSRAALGRWLAGEAP